MRQATKMLSTALTSLMALVFIAAMGLSAPSFADEKNPNIAWELIEKGALVIDVRTPEEYAQGHLDKAINIPFEQIVEGLAKHNVSKDSSIVLYCRSGRRSGIAQESLQNVGYQKTYNGGGYQSLIKH